jgi:hypothetical protein
MGTWTDRLIQNLTGRTGTTFTGTGVYYDLVAPIRESRSMPDIGEKRALAVFTTSANYQGEEEGRDGFKSEKKHSTDNGYNEDYCKAIQHVEWLLKFYRLREERAIKEQQMRKQPGISLTSYGDPAYGVATALRPASSGERNCSDAGAPEVAQKSP